MTADVSGFRALGNTRHVTGHTFGKGVDGVGSGPVDLYMTTEALPVAGDLQGGHPCSCHLPWQRLVEMVGMGIVARGTGHPFPFVHGL